MGDVGRARLRRRPELITCGFRSPLWAAGAGVVEHLTGADISHGVFRRVRSALHARTPLIFLVVAGLALILLLCAFRAAAIPFVSIALNLLSVGAALPAWSR